MIQDKIVNLDSDKIAQLLSWSVDEEPTEEDAPQEQPLSDLSSEMDSTQTLLASAGITYTGEDAAVAPQVPGFRTLGKVGEGGMGTVWRAVQEHTQREVALKILSHGRAGSSRMQLRFEREVELTARLEHPNIARLYDSGSTRGLSYYAMELFADCAHLDEFVTLRSLSVRDVVALFQSVCQGVQYAHQRGVIHRDLKPSNILVTPDGVPHIVDFGLAKTSEPIDKGLSVSLDGELLGTPAFMSPEQVRGDLDAVDTRSDVYCLGVIFYKLLTGQFPYNMDCSRVEVFHQIEQGRVLRPRYYQPRFDGDLEAILLKALALKPADRYQSVSQFSRDLENWLERLPISARPVTPIYLFKKMALRHRLATGVIGLLGVTLTCLMIFGLQVGHQYHLKNQDLVRRDAEYTAEIQQYKAKVFQHFLLSFLEYWHSGLTGQAMLFYHTSPQDSVEREMMRLILDDRSTAAKQPEIYAELGTDHPAAAEFILAECYRKEADEALAFKHYGEFLRVVREDNLDAWKIIMLRAQYLRDELRPHSAVSQEEQP